MALPAEGKHEEDSSLRWIILKIHQRCNLDCSYCYVYNRGDDSWKARPKQISNSVIDQVCLRINEHCLQFDIDEFVVELHGGEPLLVGKKRLVEIIERMRQSCTAARLTFLLQTNGTLLDDEWCGIFEEHQVSVGVSLDGPSEIADRYRYFHNGKGSTNQVLARLKKAGRFRQGVLDYGVLTVANPEIPGNELIDWYVENGIEYADVLLPLGNLANLPDNWTGSEPYTAFLLSAFDRWLTLDERAPKIRLFETMIRGHLGIKADLDALGGDLAALCVVETNGAIGISDVIRLCGGELAEDRTSVFEIAFADHAKQLGVTIVQEPSEICQRCSEFAACGGGYVPHRFDGKSFQNPSLYCDSLFALSARAKAALLEAIPQSMQKTVPDHE